MSRFVLINLVVGLVALAIGFGGFAGLPDQVVFGSRLLFGLCLLLLVSYLIASISPEPPVNKRGPRNGRPVTRPPR